MRGQLIRHIRLSWVDSLGFACFLGFVYCCLFGCNLATSNPSVAGLHTDCTLERIWAWSGAAEATGAVAVLALTHLANTKGKPLPCTCVRIAAGAMGSLGACILWLAWFMRISTEPAWLFVVGGLLCGCAMALFTMAWGKRFGSSDEEHAEFAIPLAFPISFALYLVLLVAKFNALLNLVVVLGMCAGTLLCLNRNAVEPCSCSFTVSELRNKQQTRGIASFCLLVAVSWVQIAYFRVLSSPELSGDRMTHYLYPFMAACLVSWVMLLLCINISRYLNITLAFRWSLPLFVLAYVPILTGYDDRMTRMVAYAINFVGMFGVQFGCWLGASKFVRRAGTNPALVFAGLALGEGVGISLGCTLGLFAMYANMGFVQLIALSFVLLALVQFVTMATGFNPNWVFRRTESPLDQTQQGPRSDSSASSAKRETPVEETGFGGPTVDQLCRKAARSLQATYALSDRETEVAALLLAGRSRPFIRDELFISLNTVGVHVRKVYGKCGVHSQQELIDLVRNTE